MLTSKLREALICLKAGRVTLDYPFAPHSPAPGFRGRPVVDVDLCFGCGGCAAVCPSGVILVNDIDRDRRQLQFEWGRCTYCGTCADVCPEDAIALSQDFETSTNASDDLVETIEVFMGPCGRCGRCFVPATALDRLPVRGFRYDTVRCRLGAECDGGVKGGVKGGVTSGVNTAGNAASHAASRAAGNAAVNAASTAVLT